MGNPLVRLCITKLKCNYPFFDFNVVNEISALFFVFSLGVLVSRYTKREEKY